MENHIALSFSEPKQFTVTYKNYLSCKDIVDPSFSVLWNSRRFIPILLSSKDTQFYGNILCTPSSHHFFLSDTSYNKHYNAITAPYHKDILAFAKSVEAMNRKLFIFSRGL